MQRWEVVPTCSMTPAVLFQFYKKRKRERSTGYKANNTQVYTWNREEHR